MVTVLDLVHTGPKTHRQSANGRDYTDKYLCQVDIRNANPVDVRAALRQQYSTTPPFALIIPATWDDDDYAVLGGIDLAQLDSRADMWNVGLSYSTNATDDESPTDKQTEISYSWQQRSKYTLVDKNGDGISNTAGSLYEPIEVDDPILEVRLKWNQSSFSISTFHGYRNAINSDSWGGLSAGQAKVAGLNATRKFTGNGTEYYEMEAVIQLADSWKLKLPSRGRYYLSGGLLKPFLDADKQPVDEPRYLNSGGTAEVTAANAYIQEFDIYPTMAFTGVFPTS